MKGTQFAQFSTEVLQRGAAAVLPQHLPDRWLDALLEEADLLAPGEGDPQEGDSVQECCAGLLGAVLVVLMAQRGHPDQLEVAVSTLMSHLHCSMLALAAERVSRDTEIWLEPPTLANLFDEAREVRGRHRAAEGPSTSALRGLSQQSGTTCLGDHQHPGGRVEGSMESLAEIMARVEQLAFAQEEERNALLLPPQLPMEQASLALDLPVAPLLPQPEYIQAEAFLEMSGFFTPSSKRIKRIHVKEKRLREYVDEQGTKRTVKTTIRASYGLGLPITSDLDYYRAFLKMCDEIVDRDGRFKLPIAVPSFRLARYAGKKWSEKTLKEIQEWFERMTFTGIKGAIYRAKTRDFDEALIGTVFSQVILKGKPMRNGKVADTNYVWLSPWFLSNYYYRYTRPIDFEFYKRLRKPIAKSLYTLIENGWYAAGGKLYAKSYHGLCEEFLLTPHTKFSYIKRQLDPSHHELQNLGFLERWEYRKSVYGTDYVIIYYPGQKFFSDQRAKEARRLLAEQIATWQSPSPQLELVDRSDLLLADIIATCGDQKNQAAYQKIVKDYSEPVIRMALSETHQAQLEGRITKTRGAYFTDTLKRLAQYRAPQEA